uniref:(northern house mosquito) hypothetical protein n=1 Tax=Culex pipiens TaxID=7175 RepID=A0A8D8HKP8_CULPI
MNPNPLIEVADSCQMHKTTWLENCQTMCFEMSVLLEILVVRFVVFFFTSPANVKLEKPVAFFWKMFKFIQICNTSSVKCLCVYLVYLHQTEVYISYLFQLPET